MVTSRGYKQRLRAEILHCPPMLQDYPLAPPPQVQEFDPEVIIAAYVADPPEVKKPVPRGAKKQKGGEGTTEVAAAQSQLPAAPPRAEGTRRSQRGKTEAAGIAD